MSYTPTTIQVTTANQFRELGSLRSFSMVQLSQMVARQAPIDQVALSRSLGRPVDRKDIKAAGPIIYWATWPQSAPSASQRSASACIGVTAIWLDYDGQAGNTLTRNEFEERIDLLGYECLVWNTFSADSRQVNFRAVFPLSRPISVAQHAVMFDALLKTFGSDIAPPAIESQTATQGTFISPSMSGLPTDPVLIEGVPIDTVLDVDYSVIPSRRALETEFAGNAESDFDKVFNATQRELFRVAIKFIDSYPRENWLPVCAAAIRGWGITAAMASTPESLTDAQRNLIEMLERWSCENEVVPPNAKSKYVAGTVLANVFNLQKGRKPAGLPAVVKRAVESGADLREAVDGDGALLELLDNCLVTVEVDTPVPTEILAKAVTQSHVTIESSRKAASQYEMDVEGLISSMPAGRARDYLVAIATKGQVTRFDELVSSDQFKLHPALAILAGLQIADTVMGNRVWLNTGDYGTLAANLYVLALANSGTGKSQTLDFISDVLREANYGHTYTNGKSHSGGGFYNNFIMRGPVVFQASDEAKDWLACMEVAGGGMVANQTSLNAIILTLFNQSRLGGYVTSANLMSDRSGGKIVQPPPIQEPHVNMLFIGTHDIQQSLTDKLIEDGYLARFIILNLPGDNDPEAELARKVKAQFGDGTGRNIYNEGVKAVASFLVDLDRELEGAYRGKSVSSLMATGREFVDPEGGESKGFNVLFTELQQSRFEEDRWCSLLAMDAEIGDILIEAGLPLVKLAKRHPVLSPIANREVEKIQRVALILTVMNNASADKLCPDMTRFAARLIGLMQKPWIDRLMSTEVVLVSRSNTYFPILDKLKADLATDRALFNAPEGLSATEFGNTSRAWREIIKGLRSTATGLRDDATKIMDMLGVVRVKVDGRKGYVFFHPTHAPKVYEEL